MLSVMTMESEAEALGQLATDDLEGKVKYCIRNRLILFFVIMSDYQYFFVLCTVCIARD
jgi:hypothetical protein